MKWAINLDDFIEESFHYEYHDESPASHYVVFSGTKEEAINKFLAALKPLVLSLIYESDDYGYKKEDGLKEICKVG